MKLLDPRFREDKVISAQKRILIIFVLSSSENHVLAKAGMSTENYVVLRRHLGNPGNNLHPDIII